MSELMRLLWILLGLLMQQYFALEGWPWPNA